MPTGLPLSRQPVPRHPSETGTSGSSGTFVAFELRHQERAPWRDMMHVRLIPGMNADTEQGQAVLDHIRRRADGNGIAPLSAVENGFPARQKHLPPVRAMRFDLRHMANERTAGTSQENKGLLELGRLVEE